MRIGAIALAVWLAIGAIAGAQRHDYTFKRANCTKASTIAVTVIAGPLNYLGANPRVTCRLPTAQPLALAGPPRLTFIRGRRGSHSLGAAAARVRGCRHSRRSRGPW